jgi:hypothetical protein
MEATALREQGWSISAIARHLGRNRETIRNHLNGTRVTGERRRSEPDPFGAFVPYLRERLREDPHVWATALFDEVTALGFTLSYQSFTRGLRLHALRPHCEACDGVKGRATIEIEHPPGEEILCGLPHRISYGAPRNMRQTVPLHLIRAGQSR